MKLYYVNCRYENMCTICLYRNFYLSQQMKKREALGHETLYFSWKIIKCQQGPGVVVLKLIGVLFMQI